MNQAATLSAATGAIASMTGFGNGHATINTDAHTGSLSCEVRTVNARFLDIQIRLTDDLRMLEPALREAAARSFCRGKVEIRLLWRASRNGSPTLELNEALLDQLLATQRRIRARFSDAAPLSVADVLHWHTEAARAGDDPDRSAANGSAASVSGASATERASGTGESGSPSDPTRALASAVQPLLDRVFADCVAARRREGARLATVILQQLDLMQSIVDSLRPQIPALLSDAQLRLTARLNEALPAEGMAISRDETFARVRQEVTLLSLRGDVAEELDRLQAHLAEARQTLAAGGTIGKRLDFLSQEMNREANTIASKAIALELTDAAVALKLGIEQMREQVQNIE